MFRCRALLKLFDITAKQHTLNVSENVRVYRWQCVLVAFIFLGVCFYQTLKRSFFQTVTELLLHLDWLNSAATTVTTATTTTDAAAAALALATPPFSAAINVWGKYSSQIGLDVMAVHATRSSFGIKVNSAIRNKKKRPSKRINSKMPAARNSLHYT